MYSIHRMRRTPAGNSAQTAAVSSSARAYAQLAFAATMAEHSSALPPFAADITAAYSCQESYPALASRECCRCSAPRGRCCSHACPVRGTTFGPAGQQVLTPTLPREAALQCLRPTWHGPALHPRKMTGASPSARAYGQTATPSAFVFARRLNLRHWQPLWVLRMFFGVLLEGRFAEGRPWMPRVGMVLMSGRWHEGMVARVRETEVSGLADGRRAM
jgi:hypothetical protein